MRKVARWLLRRSYQALASVIIPSAATATVGSLVRDWKRSEVLAALAPGASTAEFTPATWASLQRIDTLGLNYFLIHDFTARAYLIEPHEDRGYYDYLSRHRDRFRESTFLYKSYASPRKIRRVLQDLRGFRRSGVPRVRILDERYIQDVASKRPEAVESWIGSGDSPVNTGSSLLFVLDLAWRMGYRHVLLAGFDFSSDYFYERFLESAGVRHSPSKVVQGTDRGELMLGKAVEYITRIREDGSEVWHLGGRGPLADMLEEFDFSRRPV